MHTSSFNNMKSFVDHYLDPNKHLTIIDIGSCDVNGSYAPLFDNPLWRYRGVDQIAGINVDIVVKNPYRWKEIASSSADVVISGQTFEHIEFFWITILEISRILKNDGLCCIIAPSTGFEHKFPIDCWRFLPDGFDALCRYAHLDKLSIYCEGIDRQQDKESQVWNDCILIAKKKRLSLKEKIFSSIKRYGSQLDLV